MSELYYEMDCGCRFKQYGTNIKENDGLPPISIDFYNLPNCPKVWDLLATGKTKGVFQLESNLGQGWAERVSPKNIDEIAALSAILRPSCMDAFIGDKNITQHYADRKNKREEVESLHPSLDKILENNQQLIIYQEDALRIAKEIAAFSGVKAEVLRYAIGKKIADKMRSLKIDFINGCMSHSGLNKEDAEMIFDIIEKSQKYSFNASHSVAYSYTTYATAFCKIHFPNHFYTSWLHWSEEKIDPQQEKKDLISDAKSFGCNVYSPSLENIFLGDAGLFCLNNEAIYFGLSSVKGIGGKHVIKLIDDIRNIEKEIGKKVKKWTWLDFLFNLSPITNKTVVNNLILVGAASGSVTRKRSLFEYKLFSELTDREQAWIIKNKNSFSSLVQAMSEYLLIERKEGGPSNKKRREVIEGMVETLNNPKYDLSDEPEWISLNENQLLSVSLSNHILDSVDALSDWTIQEFLDGGPDKGILICKIDAKKEIIIKNGKSAGKVMAFVTMEDQTGKLEGVCFNNVYDKYKDMIFENNVVAVKGKRSDRDNKSLIINSLEPV
jgi:DNA polymerase-3 subunit alpha